MLSLQPDQASLVLGLALEKQARGFGDGAFEVSIAHFLTAGCLVLAVGLAGSWN